MTTDLMEFHRQSFSKQVLEHPQKAAVVKERFSERSSKNKVTSKLSSFRALRTHGQGPVCVLPKNIWLLSTSIMNEDVSTNTMFNLFTTTAFVFQKGRGRVRRYGISQGQRTRGKAKDSLRRVPKFFSSILKRLFEDETYRASQTAIGWTEEIARHVDELAPQDTRHEGRKRWEKSTLVPRTQYRWYHTAWKEYSSSRLSCSP